MSRHSSSSHLPVPIALSLFVVVLLTYARVATHGFVRFDDFDYIVDNPQVREGWSLEGLRWAFTTFHMANWHPLTWLSHMTDGQMFGVAPWGHHLVNVGLHGANAVVLFLALRLMTSATWPSAFVAAVFALHPLRVESVAWASERKDVLAGLFWMLTLLTYARYARKPGLARYLATAGCLALGLMAKPMLVSLPIVLLVLDVWPLGRLRGAAQESRVRVVIEKIPLLALCGAAAALTIAAQRGGGAVESLDVLPLSVRVANATVASVAYLWKTAWPVNLAFYYPHPALADPNGAAVLLREGVGAAVALGALTALAVWQARRRPFLLAGWLWYAITLVPVIGIVQVGNQAMADRYTYLPTIGVVVAGTWLAAELATRSALARRGIVAVASVVVVLLAVATWRQTETWRDTRAMLDRALAATANNYVAHNNLGNLLAREGDLAGAAAEYERALAIRTEFPEALNNLGIVYARTGRDIEAVDLYQRALALRPSYVKAHYNLGLSLERLGRVSEARRHYQRAIEIAPDLVEAREGLERTAAEPPKSLMGRDDTAR